MTRIVTIVLLAAASLQAQEPRWSVDVTPASYVEAWDLNDEREFAGGVQAGLDRVVWRGLAIRAEGFLLHVQQAGRDPWLRGGTVGVRMRLQSKPARVFLDVAGGRATAGERVPPRGTRSNYVLLFGGGVEIPWSRAQVSLGARWFHVSNNGSDGRHRNPDIQALGAFAGIGWQF